MGARGRKHIVIDGNSRTGKLWALGDGFDTGAIWHCCHHTKSYHQHKGYGWRYAS